jgi:hypothetical protein
MTHSTSPSPRRHRTDAALKLAAVLIAGFATTSLRGVPPTLTSIFLSRGQEWVQTDATTSAPKSPNSLFWGVEVTGTNLTAPVITLPGATNNGTLNPTQHNGGVLGFNAGDGAWEYGSLNFNNISFPNTGGASDRNARFPDGTYTIAISGLSTVSLTYNLISSTVMLFSLTNTGGSWSGGTYYFNPSQPLTISSAGTAFSNFNTTTGGQVNGAIKFGIFDGGGNPISGTTSTRFYLDDTNPATNPNYINYTLPANTLTAGSTYKVLGNYIAIADQNSANGATNMAFFNGLNSITLTAIPEPSTYAAIVGIIGLAAGFWRRRSIRRSF